VEKDKGMGNSTGFSLELMGNSDRPLEGIKFIVQISMLADGKRK
jgi:hypothetical protein